MEQHSSRYIDNAVNHFSTLPGIGKRSAIRFVLHLLKLKKENITAFSNALQSLAEDIKFCKKCNNVSDTDLCGICANPSRDNSIICIVEDLRDVLAIEATYQFKGLYHVLGGLISPLDGVGPDDINIKNLFPRIENEKIKEVIFALKSTTDGDTTSFYIFRKLSDKGIRLTTIARGIAIGDELEYTDEITLGRSIMNRVPFQGIVI